MCHIRCLYYKIKNFLLSRPIKNVSAKSFVFGAYYNNKAAAVTNKAIVIAYRHT